MYPEEDGEWQDTTRKAVTVIRAFNEVARTLAEFSAFATTEWRRGGE